MSDAPPATTIRVFVVEDQPRILKNQLKILKGCAGIEVVGTALSAEAALEALPGMDVDVVLMDLGLPRMDGIELTRRLRQGADSPEVLVFTIFEEEDKVLDAVQAGASGYLLKGAPSDKMAEAIRDVHAGGTVIQPSLARRLLRHFRMPSDGSANEARQTESGAKPLSSRETEILQLIAKGMSNNEAAGLLGVSKATIRTHLEHIYAKLEVTNRVEAVTEGIRKGLIST